MIKQVIYFVSSFLVILALAEVFIRFSNIGSVSPNEFYDDIGRGRRQNLDYVYFNEGFGIGRFNEHGYIGKSRPMEKDLNTIRIALLGDSYVEAFQVFERDYFGVIAEAILSEAYPDSRIEVLNFGRSGFDMGDMFAYHQVFVKQFNPDYVVYMVSDNDLSVENRDPLRPKVYLNNDAIQVAAEFDKAAVSRYNNFKWLIQCSVLINMLNNCLKKSKEVSVASILFDKMYSWFKPSSDQFSEIDSKKKEERIESSISMMLNKLDHRSTIIINRDNSELNKLFVELCTEQHLPFYDLSKEIIKMKEEGVDPNYWKANNRNGHWNHSAHKRIGEWLSEVLEGVITQREPK